MHFCLTGSILKARREFDQSQPLGLVLDCPILPVTPVKNKVADQLGLSRCHKRMCLQGDSRATGHGRLKGNKVNKWKKIYGHFTSNTDRLWHCDWCLLTHATYDTLASTLTPLTRCMCYMMCTWVSVLLLCFHNCVHTWSLSVISELHSNLSVFLLKEPEDLLKTCPQHTLLSSYKHAHTHIQWNSKKRRRHQGERDRQRAEVRWVSRVLALTLGEQNVSHNSVLRVTSQVLPW